MASTFEEQAIADLYAVLQDVDGVTNVFDYEPGPQDIPGEAVTIFASGRTPDEFQFQVRLYIRKPDARAAQKRLRELAHLVESRLNEQTQFGPSACSYQWVPQIDAWMALWPLAAGREDYY